MNKVRVGIIGLGKMGINHARNVAEGRAGRCELTAVSDLNPEACKNFPQAKAFSDPLEMINSGEIDAVIIATPHFTHTTLGIAALQKGVHLLVEKPISVHKADAEKLIAAWKDPQVVFAAMFNVRTVPLYIRMKQLLDSGVLGRITRIHWTVTDWFRTQAYYDSGSWRATWKGEGGGVLLNQCPHQLDLWQWMFGMPDRVTAVAGIGRYHKIEVEDDVTAILEYNDGPTGVFVTTTGETPGTNRLEVAGDGGKIIVDKGVPHIYFEKNEIPAQALIDGLQETFASASGRAPWKIEVPVIQGAGGGAHATVMKNWVDVILDGGDLIAPGAEGVKSVELGNAMLMAAIKGKPVDMPLDGAEFEALLNELIQKSPMTPKLVEMGF